MKPSARIPTRDQECDEIIWNAFKSGDKEAFATLYHRYFRILIQNGLKISADKDLVKDCIHDLFMEIWKNKLNLSTPDSVKAYLISSAQRKIIRQLKKIRSHQNEIDNMPVLQIVHSTEEQIISEQLILEQHGNVNRAMNALTKRQKQAVYLKFYVNLSYAEIASMMAISTDSIYNLVSKAIDNLQQELTKAVIR